MMHGEKMPPALWLWLVTAVLTRLIGAGAVMLYRLVMTALLLWLASLCVSLRLSQADESDSLDLTQHAERLGA